METETVFLYNSIINKLSSINMDFSKISQWILNMLQNVPPTNNLKQVYDITKNEMLVLQMLLDVQLIVDTFVHRKMIDDDVDGGRNDNDDPDPGSVIVRSQFGGGAKSRRRTRQPHYLQSSEVAERDCGVVATPDQLNNNNNNGDLIVPAMQKQSSGPCQVPTPTLDQSEINNQIHLKNEIVAISEQLPAASPVQIELAEDTIEYVDVPCTISYIESPSEFYIHLNRTMLDGLNNVINKEITDQTTNSIKYESKTDAKHCIGRYCLAYISSRRSWCRCEILDWVMCDPDKVILQLIDVGDKEFCSYKKLKPMKTLYLNIPKLAIRCHLDSFTPESVSCSSNNTVDKLSSSEWWPDDVIATFIKLSGLNGKETTSVEEEQSKKIIFRIISAKKEGNSFAINLFRDGTDQVKDNIIDLLKNNTNNNKEAQQEQQKSENKNWLIYQKDFEAVCDLFRGMKDTDNNNELERTEQNERLLATESLNKIVLPQLNSEINVFVTNFVNPCKFYVQILKESSHENTALNNLIDEINDSIQTLEKYDDRMPEIDEIVVYWHWAKKWLRGKVLSLNDNDIEIFSVDYGYVMKTTVDQIRKISTKFLKLQFQSIECNLYNSYKNPFCNMANFIKFSEMCITNRPLKAVVMSTSIPLMLQLRDPLGGDISNIMKKYDFIFEHSGTVLMTAEDSSSELTDLII